MSASSKRMRNPNELFVGDLSFFCAESHLEALFAPFGTVVEARVKRSDKGNRTLLYGFVRMDCLKSALDASKALNGVNLLGRNIRVQLSLTNSHETIPKPQGTVQIQVDFHSSFSSEALVEPTEALLRVALQSFGEIVDVVVKDYTQSQVESKQEGYAFVTFASQEMADKALADGADLEHQGIHMHCKVVTKVLKPVTESAKPVSVDSASTLMNSAMSLESEETFHENMLSLGDRVLNLNSLITQDSQLSGRWSQGTSESFSSAESFPFSSYSSADMSPSTVSPQQLNHKHLSQSRPVDSLFQHGDEFLSKAMTQQQQHARWKQQQQNTEAWNSLNGEMAVLNQQHNQIATPTYYHQQQQQQQQQARLSGIQDNNSFRRSDWIRQQQQLHQLHLNDQTMMRTSMNDHQYHQQPHADLRQQQRFAQVGNRLNYSSVPSTAAAGGGSGGLLGNGGPTRMNGRDFSRGNHNNNPYAQHGGNAHFHSNGQSHHHVQRQQSPFDHSHNDQMFGNEMKAFRHAQFSQSREANCPSSVFNSFSGESQFSNHNNNNGSSKFDAFHDTNRSNYARRSMGDQNLLSERTLSNNSGWKQSFAFGVAESRLGLADNNMRAPFNDFELSSLSPFALDAHRQPRELSIFDEPLRGSWASRDTLML